MAESFIIRDVRIFTGTEVISPGYIRIDSGVITSLGPVSGLSSSNAAPPSTKIYSKPNHTVIPGLIDGHIHADKGNPLSLKQSLRFGVTTVCDMHNEAPHVATIRKLYAEDPDTSHYKTSGQAATIENGWPIPVITAVDKSPETAAEIAAWPKLRDREGVQKYLEWNARETGNDYVKVMNESGTPIGLQLDQPSSELLRIIVDESKQRGFLVVAHSMCVKDTLQVLEAGVDGLTHTICDRPPTDELVAAYKKNNAWCNPTLATIGSLTAEGRELQEKFAHDERVKGLLGEGQSEKMCSCFEMGRGHSKVEYAYESVRRFKQAGVDVIAGSDAAGPLPGIAYGISLHHELTLYVDKCGFTPREAIESATIVPARRFRWDDRGRLAPGLRADLVLVEGDPLEDIDKLLNLRGVWRDGVLCSVYKDVLGEGVGVN